MKWQGAEELTEHTLAALEHAFDFMEAAFGDSQEMVSFVTELNTNYYSIQFLRKMTATSIISTIRNCYLTNNRKRSCPKWMRSNRI